MLPCPLLLPVLSETKVFIHRFIVPIPLTYMSLYHALKFPNFTEMPLQRNPKISEPNTSENVKTSEGRNMLQT